MSFSVFLSEDAEHDLEDLFAYISRYDSEGKAEHVLRQFEKSLAGLAETPLRGAYPKELLAVGIHEFREIHFKPYRILYRVLGRNVYVLLIADGRRDMQSLLQQRLFQS